MESLFFLKFLPAGFTLFDGKAHPSGNVVPVGAETDVSLQLHKADICFAVPSVPINVGFSGGGGSRLFLGCGGCGGGVEEEES